MVQKSPGGPQLHAGGLEVRETPGLGPAELDQHTLAWVERLHQTGRAWVTPAQLDGRWMVRLSIGSLTTERQHLETLWRDLQSVVAN